MGFRELGFRRESRVKGFRVSDPFNAQVSTDGPPTVGPESWGLL